MISTAFVSEFEKVAKEHDRASILRALGKALAFSAVGGAAGMGLGGLGGVAVGGQIGEDMHDDSVNGLDTGREGIPHADDEHSRNVHRLAGGVMGGAAGGAFGAAGGIAAGAPLGLLASLQKQKHERELKALMQRQQ